jgi:hypothetical protein
LLKTSLLMALYIVRVERILYSNSTTARCFLWRLNMDVAEPSFDHSTFPRNWARCWNTTWRVSFASSVAQARRVQLPLNEHFRVDGVVVEAC